MEEGQPQAAKELLEALNRFDRAYHMGFHRFMGQGSKPSQIFLLFIIQKHEGPGEEGMRVSDIAWHLRVTASSVTQMVTELEEKGLVVRRMDESDRRVVKVSLSPRGRELVEETRRPFAESMEELVRRLGQEKARTFIGLLGEVEAFFTESAGARSGRGPEGTR
jgi:DNA-binding MarR family transcriptional regulator